MKSHDQHDEQTRHALQAFINERAQSTQDRPTQAQLEAACAAGRAEYDRAQRQPESANDAIWYQGKHGERAFMLPSAAARAGYVLITDPEEISALNAAIGIDPQDTPHTIRKALTAELARRFNFGLLDVPEPGERDAVWNTISAANAAQVRTTLKAIDAVTNGGPAL